jgi:hypothetical protein
MKRVVILGPGGAGKSRLAAELSGSTGLPVVHLDVLFWRPGWMHAATRSSSSTFRAARACGGCSCGWFATATVDGPTCRPAALGFMRWIWRYPRDDRPEVLEALAGLDADVHHLRSPTDVRRYLGTVRATRRAGGSTQGGTALRSGTRPRAL